MTATLNLVRRYYCSAIVATLFTSSLAPVSADDTLADENWMVIAECQMVVLPQKAASPLLPDLSDDEKIDGAWVKLQQMIEHGEATLAGNLIARGDPDTALVSESVKEIRYAVNFASPQLPQSVPDNKTAEAFKSWPVSITPTTFETRKVGTRLELKAAVSKDGQWISMSVTPEHVRFLRFTKTDVGRLVSGQRLSIEQPEFTSLKETLSMQVHAGQRLLIGIHKIPGDDDEMELFFLRVRTQRTGATERH